MKEFFGYTGHNDGLSSLGTACKLSTYYKSFDTRKFSVFHDFLATHSQIFELCVDRFVGICMGGTLRIQNFKILNMRYIKLTQKTL
jgi:hypothetical protein